MPTATPKITYGKVPMFGYIDKYLDNKREGFGWDNLGRRQPKFVTLHRMYGTMAGTLSHFSNPSISSITDYAVATTVPDGAKMSGIIYRYNDPLGFRAGWASGPVSRPYGDGKAIVDKYGINAVNRDGVSIETSGYDTPFDDEAWQELVHFVAWWADFMRIPYTSWPVNPATGISGLIWHNEFTDGTGKECPFSWMRANTPRLIDDSGTTLKKYQTMVGDVSVSPTLPDPTPEEEVSHYANPAPVKALALLGKDDGDTAAALVIDGATQFRWVHDEVEAIRETKRLQRASLNAQVTGPPIKKGERFRVLWMFTAKDGNEYYLTEQWSRIVVADTKRVGD